MLKRGRKFFFDKKMAGPNKKISKERHQPKKFNIACNKYIEQNKVDDGRANKMQATIFRVSVLF